MTTARTDCPQHRQPLSECEDWDRHNHSMRFREDDWQATENAARDAGQAITERVAHGMEVMLGHLRCSRGACMTDAPPVPVTFGDLTGKPLGEWITEAGERVRRQHPRHEPVIIGAAQSQTIPATAGPLLRARARTRPGAAVLWNRAANRTSPPSRTAGARRGGRRGDRR